MVDFLKANPFVTMEDYKWGLSVPMIRLMIQDNTRVHYMSEKESKMQNATVISSAEDLMNDLGISIDIGKNND
jgi:hypothetical protein